MILKKTMDAEDATAQHHALPLGNILLLIVLF